MKKSIILLISFLLLTFSGYSQKKNKNRKKEKGQQVVVAENDGVIIKNMASINTKELEFAPTYYQKGIVYVSRPKAGTVDKKTGKTYMELFYAELDPNGLPYKAEDFSVELNSQYHEGPVTFNQKGDHIFFTRNNIKNGVRIADEKDRTNLKIYEAKRGYWDWEDIKELPFNEDGHSCMHPSLSADGTMLFFTSNKAGGYGGYDLYFSKLLNGNWSAPINMGPDINTDKQEVLPFIHESGTLFFTSNGHKGSGGADLFMIDISKSVWGNVINLGEPFNTRFDDMGIVLNKDGTKGYFSSNRQGGRGDDDIYMFEAAKGISGNRLRSSTKSEIAAYDAATSRLLAGAKIWIFERSEDGLIKDNELYDLELVPDDDNSAQMTFNLKRKKLDELGRPQQITNAEGSAIINLVTGKEYILLIAKEGYASKEINFSTYPGFQKLLEISMDMNNCLELTAKVRSETYPKGIPGALVTISNDCNDQVVQLRSNLNGEFEYCLPLGCDFILVGEKDGYAAGKSTVSTAKLRGSRSLTAEIKLKPSSFAILKEPIKKGTVIVLEDIFYDFNKSSIRSGEARDLLALAKLMEQYPSMEVELGAHTDARGTSSYNLDLSERRAKSAKDFLVARKIDASRIQVVGYGENQLRNHCADGVNCSEKEHAYNRRTEVKILHMDESVSFRN